MASSTLSTITVWNPLKIWQHSYGKEDLFLRLQDEVRKSPRPTRSYITTGFCYGLPFLQKYKEVFKGRSTLFNYGIERFQDKRDYCISVEGFQRLMNNSTKDRKLYDHVKKLFIDDVRKEMENKK